VVGVPDEMPDQRRSNEPGSPGNHDLHRLTIRD
jgi:hypothetical protein